MQYGTWYDKHEENFPNKNVECAKSEGQHSIIALEGVTLCRPVRGLV